MMFLRLDSLGVGVVVAVAGFLVFMLSLVDDLDLKESHSIVNNGIELDVYCSTFGLIQPVDVLVIKRCCISRVRVIARLISGWSMHPPGQQQACAPPIATQIHHHNIN
jgi:hypothetical protein